MTTGMWIAAAVVGWCGLAVAVAFLVAAVVKLRDLQVPTPNASIDEQLEGDDMTRAVGGSGVGGSAPPQRTASVTLVLPYEHPPKSLVGNSRAHWRQRSADTNQVRTDVMHLAMAAHLHRIEGIRHVTVEYVWAPGNRLRRDADNLWPMLKVCCDALAKGPRRGHGVGLDLVHDDTPEYFTKLPPRLEMPPAKGMWLHLTLLLGKDS